jgi:hypothetical protein
MASLRSFALPLVALVVACGGSEFTNASGTSDAGADGASSDGGATGDGSGSPTDGGACGPLPAGATDVYVDQRYSGATPTGAAACPFKTIAEGIAAANNLTGARTVHVAGDITTINYAEASAITVGTGITLRGDGPLRTKITASGTCGGGTCAVMVQSGGALDGFTVVSPNGDGITATAGNVAPALRNVSANGSKGNGVVALGSVDLGPVFTASNNGGSGVESPLAATGSIHVIGLTNAFDNNGGNGIDMNGTATLTFEGGTANGNFQGVRLAGMPSAGGPGVHQITRLTANGNKGPGGVVAYYGQSIKMRSCTLLANVNVGLLYNYAGNSTLDIGTAANDPGNNTFAVATVANRNAKAGVRLCAAKGLATQPGFGDTWSACPPQQSPLACDTAITNYSDIVYAPAAAATDPIVATTCTVGP